MLKRAVFILCILSISVFADPVVNSVSGTLEHDGIITISGTDFGSKSPAAPLVWDDGESGDPEDKWDIARPDSSDNPGVYGQTAAYRSKSEIDSLGSPYGGGVNPPHGHSIKYFSGNAYSPNRGNNGVVKTTGDVDYVYTSFYYQVDPDWTFGIHEPNDGNHKMFEINTGNNFNTGTFNYIGFWCDRIHQGLPAVRSFAHADNGDISTCPEPSCSDGDVTPMPFHPVGNWVRLEFIMDLSLDGFQKVTGDNTILWSESSCSPFTYPPNSVVLGGYARDYGESDEGAANWRYFDDVYFDTTFSRIVLANNVNYDSATIIEPQIPTAWSSSSITATMNLGGLTGDVYMFVFDADNNHNAVGYPVTIGVSNTEPSISGIDPSNFDNGDSIRISGSSFGTGPNVLLFDDFEAGTDGAELSISLATVGSWSSVSSSAWTNYSSADKVSGNLAARFESYNFPPNRHPSIYARAPTAFDSFYVSWWELIPTGDNLPGCGTVDNCNWKTIWVLDDSDNPHDADVCISSNGHDAWAVFGNDYPYEYSPYLDFESSVGVWHRFQFYIKGRTNSSGQERVWVTDSTRNTMLIKSRDRQTLNIGDEGKRQRFFINGYVRDTPDSHPTFDDVYIAYGESAQARVEIGDADTYTDCSSLTVCTPTSWTDTSIDCNVRQGSFSEGAAYLFVFDAENNHNPVGYPVSIAGSTCVHTSDDNPCDGIVSLTEIIDYVNDWKTGSVLITDLLAAVNIWKT